MLAVEPIATTSSSINKIQHQREKSTVEAVKIGTTATTSLLQLISFWLFSSSSYQDFHIKKNPKSKPNVYVVEEKSEETAQQQQQQQQQRTISVTNQRMQYSAVDVYNAAPPGPFKKVTQYSDEEIIALFSSTSISIISANTIQDIISVSVSVSVSVSGSVIINNTKKKMLLMLLFEITIQLQQPNKKQQQIHHLHNYCHRISLLFTTVTESWQHFLLLASSFLLLVGQLTSLSKSITDNICNLPPKTTTSSNCNELNCCSSTVVAH